MPGKTFAVIHLGRAFGSAVLKPTSSYSSSAVAPSPSIFFNGPAFRLGGVRNCSKGGSPSASASDTGLKQGIKLSSTSSPTPVASISTSSSSGGAQSAASLVMSPKSEGSSNGPREDAEVVESLKAGDEADYFDLSKSFTRSEKWKSKLVSTMLVYPNFISEEEEASILKEIEPYMSRMHYENSHWDDAIHEYRETERSKWDKKNELVINRIRELAFPPGVPQLKLVHILDLAKKGLIKPHIDSIRFCGNTITGLSLLSSCVMRLKHDVQTDFHCDVYLPRRSLYVMKEFSRYEFTHEILGEADSTFQKKEVTRDRRVSIICRNEPETTTGPVFKPLCN